MKVKNKHNSKIIKLLNGKAFYVVLCLCFLAVGIAAWTGIEGLKNIENAESQLQNASSDVTSTPSRPIDSGMLDNSDKEQVQVPEDDRSTEEVTEPNEPDPEQSEQTAAPVAAFFVNPVLGDILKDFSDTELQYSMTMNDMRLHKGLDIIADVGTPVVASGEGIVIQVYNDPMYGSTVVIDHGNGIVAKYCGLNSKPLVKVGDSVDSTKQIGAVDVIPSESVEQRHLHLEFYKDGKAVSPLDYIAK